MEQSHECPESFGYAWCGAALCAAAKIILVPAMLDASLGDDFVRIGERFSLTLHRTLRVPDDGRPYPLPPGLGRLPLYRASAVAALPPQWGENDLVVGLHQREALWLGFNAASWKPNAVKIGIGGINAVTGVPWDERLRADPQDYLVAPPQLWLDGIKTGSGTVRQFVAAPLGRGDTVEGQISGKEETGGIQIVVFEPRSGRFPEQPPPDRDARFRLAAPISMGLAAGGEIHQDIYADPYGLDTWDSETRGRVFIHLVNSEQYAALTGQPLPPPPIDAATYTALGLPWFDLVAGGLADLPASPLLAGVTPLQAREADRGEADPASGAPVEVPDQQVRRRDHGAPPPTSR